MSSLGALAAVVLSLCTSWFPTFSKGYDIVAELGPHLSPNAAIVLPGSERFEQDSLRWQTFRQPNISVFVEVAAEEDIQETIKFANRHGVPFLAVAGSHGATNSLAKVNHGIGIWMRRMSKVRIQPDGKTARIEGGVLSKEVTDALWQNGKQTVTGGCECTGVVAPMLGGGHGWLQGRYGLLADNLLEARLVLANGTGITVSKTSYSDLFWAIRGAGHNFGVVSEFLYKIYDVPPGNTWAVETFIFKSDKVELVYQEINDLTKDGNQPVEVINFSYFLWMPEIDPSNPVILLFILHEGSTEEAKSFSAPFHALGPVSATSSSASFPELPGLTGLDNAAPGCQKGYSVLRFPTSLQKYDLTAQRKVFNLFREVTTEHPSLNGSLFLWEGYSLQGVQSVPSESTAFPDRAANLLVSPALIYATNKSLDAIAVKAGKDMRTALRRTNGHNKSIAYVNYAHGDESQGELYGHEKWRLDRLKALKKLYDPYGRFSFYAPIL